MSVFCGELDSEPAHNACPWLSRMWVASVVSCIWTLLTTPVLGSPECEWLMLWLTSCIKLPNYFQLQDVCAWCALLSVKSTDCTNSSPIHFLITLHFDCSDCMCCLNTDLVMHLTLWLGIKGYVIAHHSKCMVFVQQLFACIAHGIFFLSTLPLASVLVISYLVFPVTFVRA